MRYKSYLSLSILLETVTGNPTSQNTFILGGGVITINWVIHITTLSTGTNTYTFQFGLGDTITGGDQANGVYIQYSSGLNSGNWVGTCAASSSRTSVSSSTAVTTGWHNGQIVINAAGTSASFTMDGVSLGSAVIANLPSVAVSPFLIVVRTAGTIAANSVGFDLFYLNQVLTTAR